jgi:membrane-associated phospholipid phosphatase
VRIARSTVALALLAAAGRAPAAGPVPLEYHLGADLALTGGAAAAGVVLTLALPPPGACRICGTTGLDDDARRAFLWEDSRAAARWSDVLAFGAIPVALVGGLWLSARAAGDPQAVLVDALVVAEAASVSFLLGQAVKELAARPRPYVLAGRELPWASESERYLSFYSGHTALSFSAAVAAATVAFQRGYRSAWLLTAGGLAAAAFVGYLRIAADMHHLTDVLAGAAAGALVGFAVPSLLHPPRPAGAPAPLSVRLGGIAFAF